MAASIETGVTQGSSLNITIHTSVAELGQAAAREGAEAIRQAIASKGRASIVLATGASQFETLEALIASDIDFSKVTAFHLDEYVGMDDQHPASFRRYLRERVLDRVPDFQEFVLVAGDAPDLDAELARLNARIGEEVIDVCFAGIGENAHLAFNDPPANFETTDPYIVVDLDEACRLQQLGEGWFETLADVPHRAISMSIQQILKSRKIVLSVPDLRKAAAVAASVEGPITPTAPASILQNHPAVSLHLDVPSGSALSDAKRVG